MIASSGALQVDVDGFTTRAYVCKPAVKPGAFLTCWIPTGNLVSSVTDVSFLVITNMAKSPCTVWQDKTAGRTQMAQTDIVLAITFGRGHQHLCQLHLLNSTLSLVQMQAAAAKPCSLHLLAADIQIPEPALRVPLGSFGLGRAMRAENPHVPTRCIDCSFHAAFKQLQESSEPEMAHRTALRIAPRLTRAGVCFLDSYLGYFQRGGAHLVTGGTGGLGLLSARWLAQRGAFCVTLLARHALAKPDEQWKRLVSSAASVRSVTCDVAARVDVKRVMLTLSGSSPHPEGVWHTAGTNADNLLPKQTMVSLRQVVSPKVAGETGLRLTCHSSALSAYVLFSSVVGLFEMPGQANYSIANAYLDHVAASRRTSGSAAVSIQWGPWAHLGMAARGAAAKRVGASLSATSGFRALELDQGLAALHAATQLQSAPVTCAAALDSNCGRPRRHTQALLLEILQPAVIHDKERCRRLGVDATTANELAVSTERVLAILQQMTGAAIDQDIPLIDAGVDSLGAIELRNQLQDAVGSEAILSSTLMFDQPTPRQLLLHLHEDRTPHTKSSTSTQVLSVPTKQIQLTSFSALLPGGVSASSSMTSSLDHCGSDRMTMIPSHRWNLRYASFDASNVCVDPQVALRIQYGGCIHNLELFDATQFAISVAEASAMDPQQRLLLEQSQACWHSINVPKSMLVGSNLAVCVGQWESDFARVLMCSPAGRGVFAATGSQCSALCGRISYTYGLHGSCVSFNTACSSSLVAAQSSMHMLLLLQCDESLLAGVNMLLDPFMMRGEACRK